MNSIASAHEALLEPIRSWHRAETTDVLVIGAGIAGLSFVLRLPEHLRVVVVTKGSLGESNTWYAQGGLAAAVGADDDPGLHFADTIAAGADLCNEDAVRELVDGGPAAVRWLIEHGTRFDVEDNVLALGREAAHSRNRVVHAGGDATGAEIERSLVAQLRVRPTVTILDHTTALDLVVSPDGSCAGAIVVGEASAERVYLAAATTVLANGGAGQLWAVTSNPPGATGDGIAMALRAGVAMADLEFTQFHPTVLAGDGLDPFLITEAIRGEGAYLRSADGVRFMPNIHELAELAPRDIVARAIQRQVAEDGGRPVFLDLRHLDPDMVRRRFPTIGGRLATYGLSLTTNLIPVAPAAHYFMGGIVADSQGRTSMDGLLAIGEVSCTGVHGANRLASNSLLEGLVFGLRAADWIAATDPRRPAGAPLSDSLERGDTGTSIEAMRAIRARIQQVLSVHVAVVRNETGMRAALADLDAIGERARTMDAIAAIEVRNLLLLAHEVTRSALAREESRGAHFRDDFPERDPRLDHRHQVVHASSGGVERRCGALLPQESIS
ncbi:MAG: L-aspartate oxidase [Chloroflexia bacterium]|nr:L-aspartate oxidase [Chloroflexia bacterium]